MLNCYYPYWLFRSFVHPHFLWVKYHSIIAKMIARIGHKHLKPMSNHEESGSKVIAVSKQQESRSEVIVNDKISCLLDSLLHHILSFLQTREVIATSLLSKRWRSLWCSMPTFDFDDGRTSSLDFFIQFVDVVLLLADLRPIEKFRFKYQRFCVRNKGKRLEQKGVPPVKINI